MSAATPPGTTAILRAEARLFGREPGTLFWVLAFPTLLLVILGLIPSFRDPSQGVDGVSLVALYVPIVVLVSMLLASFQSMPGVLTGYRERGILRRISTTPAHPAALLAAQFLLHIAAVLVSTGLALTVARVAFGVGLPDQAAGYALVFVLATAAALALGSMIAAVAPNTKVATAVGMVVFFMMMFGAGVWIPVAAMPDLMRRIVEYTPTGAAALGLGQAAAGSWPAVHHVLVLVVWILVAATVAVRSFRWE